MNTGVRALRRGAQLQGAKAVFLKEIFIRFFVFHLDRRQPSRDPARLVCRGLSAPTVARHSTHPHEGLSGRRS